MCGSVSAYGSAQGVHGGKAAKLAHAKGTFSTFADGTFVVKTKNGLVAILPKDGSMKAALAALRPGDQIEVTGSKSRVSGGDVNAFNGPAIEATKIKVISRAPVPPTIEGSVMEIIPIRGGDPQGVFLMLDNPVSLNGQEYRQVQLPAEYSRDLGGRFKLQGELEATTSPNGVGYAKFKSAAGITVLERPLVNRAATDTFTP